jgi:hypothetical protein
MIGEINIINMFLKILFSSLLPTHLIETYVYTNVNAIVKGYDRIILYAKLIPSNLIPK